MKRFELPENYRSTRTGALKEWMAMRDPHRRSLAPVSLDFGMLTIRFPRHFGFCFGVQNAIEKIYKVLEDADGKPVYLVSQMIHNPIVNRDLEERGVRFLFDTEGRELLSHGMSGSPSVVVIPAFGISIERIEMLRNSGVELAMEDTTCPFVDKVWRRAEQLGGQGYTVVVHGKAEHEETKATFSHAAASGHAVVIRNMEEAKLLGSVIMADKDKIFFDRQFGANATNGFDPDVHLKRIGVVNQTTMLASETLAIGMILREAMKNRYGTDKGHYADTRDTLCYATHENQEATLELIARAADVALVVGGKNSSNTGHLVDLCADTLPTLFVTADAPLSRLWQDSEAWRGLPGDIPDVKSIDIVSITSGASCPDTEVDRVVDELLGMRGIGTSWDDAMNALMGSA